MYPTARICPSAIGGDRPEPTGSEVSKQMKARGFTIASGYKALKETSFRIGHMGDHTVPELEAVLAALEEVLGRG